MITKQFNFSGGELAPALNERVDQSRYQSGLRTFRNMMNKKSGGAENRPGTTYVAEVKSSSAQVRLIPFIFNTDQTYLLEFGNLYMRVYRNGAQLTLTPQSITGITNANPAVVTYSGADTYANGDEIYISGITSGMGDFLNGRNFKVAGVNTGTNTFQLTSLGGSNIDSTGFGTYSSGGGTVAEVYEIVTPYVTADLPTLQFVQSADIITIVHNNYAPQTLSRSGHTSWTLAAITFGPAQAGPASVAVTPDPGIIPKTWVYGVSSVSSETGEESLITVSNATAGAPSVSVPKTLTWGAVTGSFKYNIYRKQTAYGGIGGYVALFGYLGTTTGTTFTDDGTVAVNFALLAPETARTPGNGQNPGVVALYQQRSCYANVTTNTEGIWASRTGSPKNFNLTFPSTDADPITFSLLWKYVSNIRHLVDANGKLLIFTGGGEGAAEGDAAGIFKSTAINAKQYTANGASTLRPLYVNGTILYLQARQSIVRDFGFEFETESFRGNDLTTFSNHLTEGYTIVDWDYQQNPNSTVWLVRSDGVLLGLAYIKEHGIVGWSRHDTVGTFENVCVIPEGTEDVTYFVVKRTINGATKRYIERMANRTFLDNPYNAHFVDCGLVYDGRNTSSTATSSITMTYTEPAGVPKLTASSGYFLASDVGKKIFLYTSAANQKTATGIVANIDVVSSSTVVEVTPFSTIAVNSVFSIWSKAVSTVTGAWHLENTEVSVTGDSIVIHNPNKTTSFFTQISNIGLTLSGGTTWVAGQSVTVTADTALFSNNPTDVGRLITLQGVSGDLIDITITAYTSTTVVTATLGSALPVNMRNTSLTNWNWTKVRNGKVETNNFYSVIRLGEPYTSDMETLNLETAQGPTLIERGKLIEKVTVSVKDTSTFLTGVEDPDTDTYNPSSVAALTAPRFTNLYSNYVGAIAIDPYVGPPIPITLYTEALEVWSNSKWNHNGRVFVRQSDPLPLTVLAIAPSGYISR